MTKFKDTIQMLNLVPVGRVIDFEFEYTKAKPTTLNNNATSVAKSVKAKEGYVETPEKVFTVGCTSNYMDDYEVIFRISWIKCNGKYLSGHQYLDEKEYVRDAYKYNSVFNKKFIQTAKLKLSNF